MNKPNFIAAAFFIFLMLGAAFAQTPERAATDASFDIVLNLYAGSNNRSAKPVSQSAAKALSEVRGLLPYSDYHLVSTDFQRVSNTGTVSQRTFMDQLIADGNSRVFANWTLSGLRGDDGGSKIAFQTFAFEARIPVAANSTNSEGKFIPTVNYEAIGLTLQRFSIPENVPTVIGTLAMPKADESLIFVLTVTRSK